MNTSAKSLDIDPILLETTDAPGGLFHTLSNALIITRREVRDSFRDWRIIGPIVILTFLFPFLAQFVAARFATYLEGFGAQIIGERTIPFLLMIVGFFPISISLVIALETFVGEKERRSLEPLLSTPLSNTELYVGKTLAAMLPPLISSYGGMAVYLLSLLTGDLAWRPQLWLVVQIILITTVQALVMVTGAVVVSSQATSTRAANLLASFIIIPMALIIQGESAIMFLAPDAESPSGIGALWAIIGGMFIVVILLLRVGNSIFNREELLGRTLDTINLKALFRHIFQSIRAVDEQGTPARSLFDWYRRGVTLSLKRLRLALPITLAIFAVAFIGGILLGQLPSWQMNLPRGLPIRSVAGDIQFYTGLVFGETHPILAIVWQNGRILLGATILALFTFGTGALILTPPVYVILGYVFAQLINAGYDPSFMLPAVLTHGIIEIPVIVLATAAALRLGAVVTRLPSGLTLGGAWTQALGDTIKIGIGIIVPGLILAAAVEAYITPQVVQLMLGG
ncbi:MAG: stage II sporulation protein M [Anaerolineae bacterium]|nr:stage II sporulation protein M [Anaerolineae bacterium]NUQ03737.1 stage II sporulation protein M [Anaerolineae bacterium]